MLIICTQVLMCDCYVHSCTTCIYISKSPQSLACFNALADTVSTIHNTFPVYSTIAKARSAESSGSRINEQQIDGLCYMHAWLKF